jgi:hypothetical protein
MLLKMANASYTTIFTLRGIRPSVRHEVRSGIGEALQQQGSVIGRTHPHHLTASRPPYGLKVVGRREYNNVIRNPCKNVNQNIRKYKSERMKVN